MREQLAKYGQELWVDYYRPISEYNIGKVAEHGSRKWYKESNTYGHIN